MITIYTSPSCSSCRKVKEYFDSKKVPYKEKNILTFPLKEEELKKILSMSENGTDDIISNRSKIIKEKKIKVEDMTINELIKFIKENPTVLKRPILINEVNMQVGYSEDDISAFLPVARRFIDEDYCKNCQNKVCDRVKNKDKYF